MLGPPLIHYQHQTHLNTKRQPRCWSSALSLEVPTTGQPCPLCRNMFKTSLCHILNSTGKMEIRPVSGRLIAGLFIDQQNFVIGCLPPIHESGFIMLQQIAQVFSSHAMLESSEFSSLRSDVLPSRTLSKVLWNNWTRGLSQTWWPLKTVYLWFRFSLSVG
jgi:hypothetical protein